MTWRGDHCITSTTFCTAASLITLAIEPHAIGRHKDLVLQGSGGGTDDGRRLLARRVLTAAAAQWFRRGRSGSNIEQLHQWP